MERMLMLLWQRNRPLLILCLLNFIPGDLIGQILHQLFLLVWNGAFPARLQVRGDVIDQHGTGSASHGPRKDTGKHSQGVLVVCETQFIKINWKGEKPLEKIKGTDQVILTCQGKTDGDVGEESIGRIPHKGHGDCRGDGEGGAWRQGQPSIVRDPDETFLSGFRFVLCLSFGVLG